MVNVIMTTNRHMTWTPPRRRRLFLMRHADVDYFDASGRPYRPETVPLTARGCEQARALGAVLAPIPFDLVITSGLRRTDETANLVLGARSIRCEVEPLLREIETGRMSAWGNAPETLVRQIILGALDEQLTSESRFLAGETFGSCQQRVQGVWKELLRRRDWNVLLVVAHGVVNRLLLAEALGLSLGSLGRLEQDACCINLLEIEDSGRCLLRLLNFTAHDAMKELLTLTSWEGLYDQYLRGRSVSAQE